MFTRFHRMPVFAPNDGAGAAPAGVADPAPANPAAAAAAPGPGWLTALPDDLRTFVTAKGVTSDDPAEALAKLLPMHRSAEQRIGKGLDKILERPAEGQAWADWARANAAALGLPDTEDGYQIEKPEFWPKDAPWDDAQVAAARKIAHEHGVPPSALSALVEMQARHVQAINEGLETQIRAANEKLGQQLKTEWGAEYDRKLAMAQQGATRLAEAAGLAPDAIEAFTAALAPKTGDAVVMRMFAAVGELMGEDTAVGLGQGGGLAISPEEARAELDASFGADSAWAKAAAARDHATLARLKPRYEQLVRAATGGRR
jgi:hypothetical protein